MKKVLYEELRPEELVQRVQEMPVAYLPLGTLEWHGPHMPLGADGIQSKELFVRVAEKVGGVVLPMLFMGPDRIFHDGGKAFYGMDINTEGTLHTYCVQQLKGSAYWFRSTCAVFLPSFPEWESVLLSDMDTVRRQTPLRRWRKRQKKSMACVF